MKQETVLITGGTSGIGLAAARLLYDRGANVLVTGRNPETIRSARGALPSKVAIVQADVASIDDTDRVIEEARDRFGSLTGVFLNAGINKSLPLEAVDEDTYDEVFAVNAKGQFFMLQKALPLLEDNASVVFTVGIAAIRGLAGASLGAGSKGALLAMLPSLAVELAPRGIRVNAVSPGAVSSPIWTKSGMSADQVAAVTESMAAEIPLRRFGEASDVATTVAFLLSADAAYITGENLVVGGGAGLMAF